MPSYFWEVCIAKLMAEGGLTTFLTSAVQDLALFGKLGGQQEEQREWDAFEAER